MLNLGTKTGSLVNHIHSRAVKGEPNPEVGMGATVLMWTDRKAATIQNVFTKGKFTYIEITLDEAKRVDDNGMSEDQRYLYIPRPDGHRHVYRKGSKEYWEEVRINEKTGRYNKIPGGGNGLRIGIREEYHDFTF